MLNGVTKVVMTKADVLDSFDELKVCVNYSIEGQETDRVPFQLMQVNMKPEYKSFNGWNIDTTAIKNSNDLPAEMQQYISFINQYIKAPVSYVSNGPQRDQVIAVA